MLTRKIRRHILPFIGALCLTVAFTNVAAAQADGLVGGLLVGKALDDFADRLDNLLARATQNVDYLSEKNARKVSLIVENARAMLHEELEMSFDRLSIENQGLLATVKELVDEAGEAQDRLLELEDFLALDLQAVLDAVPSLTPKNKVYLLRRVDGYSQMFQPTGAYTFRVVGNAFGPGYYSKIVVDGTRVRMLDMRSRRAHTLDFDVPARLLNRKFSDKDIVRVDIQIESYSTDSDKPVFAYSDKILLLPKLPVQYTLTEHHTRRQWSKDNYWTAEASTFIARTGKSAKGEEPSNHGDVSVTIPEGCLLVKGAVACRVTPDIPWGRWLDDVRHSNADRTVSRTFKHWIHDQDRTIFMKVQYRKPESSDSDTQRHSTDSAHKGRLPFGTSFFKFSNAYRSHTLKVTWFNGRSYVLAPTQRTAVGVRSDLENLSNFKRLVVNVKWPEPRVKP